jgi:hypothetical protein
LDQGSSYDNLRALRDAGEWEPMGIQTAPADKEVPGIQREGSVMNNPLWMLVPWAVFAVAAGLKICHLTSLSRKHLLRDHHEPNASGRDWCGSGRVRFFIALQGRHDLRCQNKHKF